MRGSQQLHSRIFAWIMDMDFGEMAGAMQEEAKRPGGMEAIPPGSHVVKRGAVRLDARAYGGHGGRGGGGPGGAAHDVWVSRRSNVYAVRKRILRVLDQQVIHPSHVPAPARLVRFAARLDPSPSFTTSPRTRLLSPLSSILSAGSFLPRCAQVMHGI